jgi:hypothetical protein
MVTITTDVYFAYIESEYNLTTIGSVSLHFHQVEY